MSRIRAKNTNPELIVRRMLRQLKLRFRAHVKNIPGTPDFVLGNKQTVIFVHGCFWHRHPKCRYAYTPKSRRAFWLEKFNTNLSRDAVQRKMLRKKRIHVMTVWECETKQPERLKQRLQLL
jgi:DNA mismatch endonuclease (patch repair protein)